jgi:hypothetical protein
VCLGAHVERTVVGNWEEAYGLWGAMGGYNRLRWKGVESQSWGRKSELSKDIWTSESMPIITSKRHLSLSLLSPHLSRTPKGKGNGCASASLLSLGPWESHNHILKLITPRLTIILTCNFYM